MLYLVALWICLIVNCDERLQQPNGTISPIVAKPGQAVVKQTVFVEEFIAEPSSLINISFNTYKSKRTDHKINYLKYMKITIDNVFVRIYLRNISVYLTSIMILDR